VLTGERDELMANTAAYSGVRWGELTALTTGQIDQVGRVITVDRKVVEVAGHLYREPPKNRKCRPSPPDNPRRATGSPTASNRPAPSKPLALTRWGWSSPRRPESAGGRPTSAATSSRSATWRPAGATAGRGTWTWHSLRHVFCTTAVFIWKLAAADVSRMVGDANDRITLDMYVGTTTGILDRARIATQ
jgi:integrase